MAQNQLDVFHVFLSKILIQKTFLLQKRLLDELLCLERKGGFMPRKNLYSSSATTEKQIARLTNINNQEFIKVETPYNKEFVNELKKSITSTKRAYVATDRYWLVAYDQLKFILHLCNERFSDVLLFGFPEEITGRDNCFGVLYLLPTAPLNVIKSAYRTLAAMYHPDNQQTGDSEKMIVLNQAYSQCVKCVESKTTDWSF